MTEAGGPSLLLQALSEKERFRFHALPGHYFADRPRRGTGVIEPDPADARVSSETIAFGQQHLLPD